MAHKVEKCDQAREGDKFWNVFWLAIYKAARGRAILRKCVGRDYINSKKSQMTLSNMVQLITPSGNDKPEPVAMLIQKRNIETRLTE